MCEYGDSVALDIANGKIADVDRCIAPLVKALNDAGFATRACCCGHGYRPATVILRDGRELHIARNFEEGRQIDRLFPLDIHGDTVSHLDAGSG